MSVLETAIKLRDASNSAAGNFVLTLKKEGRQSEYFLDRWAELRAESLEYFATHEIIRPLQVERFKELNKRWTRR